ncbi:hypothetical protein GIB67_002225, partial [Kingdonia uniflora]
MASISGCAKADEADLVGQLTPVIGVGDEEDTVAELIEWPRLKGSRVEYPTGSSRFREFCRAKSSIDGIWGHAFTYRGNFFKTCSISQEGDYLYLLPDLAKEKKCRHLGDEVSLEYVQGVVKDSQTDRFCCYLAQFDYGLTLALRNLVKSVMNLIRACPAQFNCNFWEVILVCKTLNGRWAAFGSERMITAKDFLEYYAVKYVTATDGAYLLSSSSRPCFFDLPSAGRVWNDNLLWVSGECHQRSDEEPLELNNRTITKGSMEEKLSTPKLNTPLKLARLNEILDGPVDMATVSSTAVRRLAKRKAIKRGAAPRSITSISVDDSSKRRKVTSPIKSQEVLEESDKIAEGADLRLRFEVEAGLLEEQCRAKARKKMVAVMDDEFKKFARALRNIQLGFQDRSMELEKRISQLEGEKKQAESEAEAERLVTASAISRNNLAEKLYQLRYTKVEIIVFSEGNYEEMEIMDEEEVEEREDGLNDVEKTAADNQETIKQEIESSRLRVVDLEGLLEVEKKSSAELHFRMFVYVPFVLHPKLVIIGRPRKNWLSRAYVAREREEQTLLYNAEYTEEYEVLFSQYEGRLDDNVKLSLKLEEAKRQFEEKTATILSRDLALNQHTSELAELKEKVASGSRHELLKGEIKLDTAQTNLAVSETDFEKLSSSIMGKDQKLHKSAQIRDSLIARLDRVKADLRRLKGREAQSRANVAEIQAKNKSLVDNLAHARGNVMRDVQRENEMNERINQLCALISESKRELLVREIKYQKDLKFELDKRDGEITSGEGCREMKEFLHRKEELVENMRIDLTNSQQKSIDLTRQMSERINQLTAKLPKSKVHRLKDNKRAAVTHQAFKELVVHEQEKCDGEALHQRQLSALVAFYVEEIKFLQVEKDLMQDCFSGRTCVYKLDISSIDSIGVMDHGIGTTMAEQIARGREIVAKRALEYMASRTEIGGSSSVISPTLVVGG